MSEQRVLGVPRVHSIAYLVRVVKVIPWDVVINTFTRMDEGGAANHLPPLTPDSLKCQTRVSDFVRGHAFSAFMNE